MTESELIRLLVVGFAGGAAFFILSEIAELVISEVQYRLAVREWERSQRYGISEAFQEEQI